MYSAFMETITYHPLVFGGIAIFLWYAVSTATSWYRLRHIPGPFLASISDLWMIRASTSTRLSEIFEQLGREYGPLVRIGPNQILTSDADFLRKSGAVRGTYNRSTWYVAFRWQPYIDSTFNFLDHAVHDKRKGQIATAYNISGREVDLIEPSIDEQILVMVDLLRDKYLPNPEKPPPPLLDFSDLSSYLTMDVITRAAFGHEFGHMKTDSDVTGFLTNLREAWPIVSLVNEWPALRTIMYSRMYLSLFGPKVTDQSGLGKLMSGVVKVVKERFEKPGSQKRNDMLGSWIQHGISQEECEAEGMLALIAGSETTASVMRITLLCILSSPPVYQKLKNVVKDAVTSGAVSNPISYEEAKSIPYLRAVVYEGMRMRPGTTGAFSKIVPPQGETVQGLYIPGGTVIAMNIPSLLRSSEIFGPDAGLFRPERWLEATDKKRNEMEREVEMMFGSGRWMCAGKPIAFMELYKTFFELLHHFDFQVANPSRPWNSRCYNVFVEENMLIRVSGVE
ncbi:Pisatin demethylase [Cytospora mali]|uniref:Pisatin demethylase n=1 Tax=Cytospora mali TaxID=578113 RepID=A0A194VI02_CYTMA|nr:Pisatin demethylase [Valsa mali]